MKKSLKFLLLTILVGISITAKAQGQWNIGNIPDQFGDATSEKYVSRTWVGLRDGQSECGLGIRVSKKYGMELVVLYNDETDDMAGLTITGKFNGKVFNLPLRGVTDNNLIYLEGGAERTLYKYLVSTGTLKLSFHTDAYGSNHNRVFTIQCPNGLYTALKKIGLMFR